MGAEYIDLLVIGGGINGVGVARDAAGRGLKVVLVERSDLASATSSASTKLVHGGLRYLESFEFRLVRESLQERERLLAIAPHIVRPMRFILPHVEGLRPRWQIRLGLFFYDHVGARGRIPASRGVRLAGRGYGEPLREQIAHGFEYSDCAVDDSRLVVLNAVDAANRGATIHTRTQFESAQRVNGRWLAECRDTQSERSFQLSARAIVNASGPWVDRVLQCMPGTRGGSRLRLVRGSHIVVPRLYDGEHAYLLQHPDGRVVFTIPYEGAFTLIGTTDVPCESAPDVPEAATEEIEYLCATVNDYFRRGITARDIVWMFAGVRPLVDDAAAEVSKVTRDYRLELSAEQPALLSVFGGKLTTYRKLAETVLEKLHPFIGGPQQSWTDRAPLPGGDLAQGDFAAFGAEVRRRWSFLPESLALRMARAYGTRMEMILGTASSIRDLGEHFGAGLTAAEVRYLVASEWAITAEDILWRRTKVGLHMTEAQRASVQRYLDVGASSAQSAAATART
jgi:glycerol-3-phosphate dehydrogenase